jgi:cytochrome c5
MKNKILSLAILSIVFVACATKNKVVDVNKEKEKEIIVVEKDVERFNEGKALYENNCAKCHKLYDTKQFNANDWKPIVEIMRKKAKLTEEEGDKIFYYVISN